AEPEIFRELLHRIAQASVGYLKAQIAAGAAAVQLFDTWCGELALPEFRAFVLPAVQEIITSVRDTAPVIYYSKASHHLLPAVLQCGGQVVRCDLRVHLADLRKLAGPKIALQGNLDPAALFAPHEQIRAATSEILRQLGGVGHILNLGHGILPNTSVDAAELFIRTGQGFSFTTPPR